jgi:hypothetical protein
MKYYIVIILVILFVLILLNKSINNFNNTDTNLTLVISRYNEDLLWLNEDIFKNYKVICYNKGSNQNFVIQQEHKIIDLPNVGREYHTYLYYIYQNYDNLPNNILFLPGSLNRENKIGKAKQIIKKINDTNKLSIFGHIFKIKTKWYDFILNEYDSTNEKNYELSSVRQLTPCSVRPFGKWFEDKLGNQKDFGLVSLFGIAILTKEIILKNPKKFYKPFIDELEVSSNPEVGHFLERSFYSLFDIPDHMKDIYDELYDV